MNDRDREILRRWREGGSGGVIGEAMSVTRSAVLGVVTRAKARGRARPRAGTRERRDTEAGEVADHSRSAAAARRESETVIRQAAAARRGGVHRDRAY